MLGECNIVGIALYCIVLYCIVLYCIVLYCIVIKVYNFSHAQSEIHISSTLLVLVIMNGSVTMVEISYTCLTVSAQPKEEINLGRVEMTISLYHIQQRLKELLCAVRRT